MVNDMTHKQYFANMRRLTKSSTVIDSNTRFKIRHLSTLSFNQVINLHFAVKLYHFKQSHVFTFFQSDIPLIENAIAKHYGKPKAS